MLLFSHLSYTFFQDKTEALVLSDGKYKLEVNTENLTLRFYC